MSAGAAKQEAGYPDRVRCYSKDAENSGLNKFIPNIILQSSEDSESPPLISHLYDVLIVSPLIQGYFLLDGNTASGAHPPDLCFTKVINV